MHPLVGQPELVFLNHPDCDLIYTKFFLLPISRSSQRFMASKREACGTVDRQKSCKSFCLCFLQSLNPENSEIVIEGRKRRSASAQSGESVSCFPSQFLVQQDHVVAPLPPGPRHFTGKGGDKGMLATKVHLSSVVDRGAMAED